MILLYIIESTLSERIACFFLFQKSPKSPKVPKSLNWFFGVSENMKERHDPTVTPLFFYFSWIILYLNNSASFSPSFSPRISSFMAIILPLASTM